ncbi:MAG TPA: SAM-dependent methyltransferase [Amycolatopsis sp.]|nr:SAM-dependent methyltransferase [Amycolatopsis sp.]
MPSPDSLPPVSKTALGVAMLRARESRRPDRLFDDPYAQLFVDAGGAVVPVPDAAARAGAGSLVRYAQVPVRTRFYDDYLLGATAAGCRQVVLPAAGLDTRAFRLAWPEGVRLFELDLPGVLEFKESVLAGRVTPRCARTVVPADLRADWPDKLLAAGFRPGAATAWLIEGLLIYLSYDEAARMLTAVGELSAPCSRVSFEYHPRAGDGFISRARETPGMREVTALWKGGLGERALDWLTEHGWRPRTSLSSALAEEYGRPGEGVDVGGFVTAER